MGLGGCLQWVELFQFFSGDLLERCGDGSFFDIDFFPGQVFKMLYRLRERLEADRLPRRKERRLETSVAGQRRAGGGVLVVVVAVALVGDFDLTCSEERGEDQPQHVTLPTVGRAAEASLQRLSHAGVFVAVAVFAFQVIKNLFSDIGVDVDDVLRPIFDDQPQPVIPDVENVGESFQVGGFENLLGFVPLERARTHL